MATLTQIAVHAGVVVVATSRPKKIACTGGGASIVQVQQPQSQPQQGGSAEQWSIGSA